MDRPDDCIEPGSRRELENCIPLARPVGLTNEVTPPVQHNPETEFLLPAISARDALTDLLLFTVLFVPLMLVGEILMISIYDAIAEGSFADEAARESALRRSILVPAILWRVILSAIIAYWLVRRRGLTLRGVGLAWGRWWVDLLVGLGAFGVIAFGTILFSILIPVLFPDLDREFQRNTELILDAVPKIPFWALGPFSLAIGFYEELLFRGLLMPRLRRATGSWVLAVILTTAVFSVLHLADQAAAALLAICALSLIFSIITIWRRSLVPAIVAHTLFDWGMFILIFSQPGVR